MFYVNKSDYKTSYATAIVDRFIRTIKDKLERYQKLNDSKSIIQAVKDIVANRLINFVKVLPLNMNETNIQNFFKYFKFRIVFIMRI